MTELLPLFALGAGHGINPAMGWLFAVALGLQRESRRAVWQLGQVKVYDGGSDGDASTAADNTLFMDQGVFIP